MEFEYPLREKTGWNRIKSNSLQIRKERRKPQLPGPYIYVGDFPGDPLTTWQSPPWTPGNNFDSFGTAYVGFRHGLDGYVEFIGKLDLTLGAVTGTVAFTLPNPWTAISFDYTFPIFAGGTDWQAGIMSVNPLGDGDVYVYWPVQATAI